jgi:hypothetical protein
MDMNGLLPMEDVAKSYNCQADTLVEPSLVSEEAPSLEKMEAHKILRGSRKHRSRAESPAKKWTLACSN